MAQDITYGEVQEDISKDKANQAKGGILTNMRSRLQAKLSLVTKRCKAKERPELKWPPGEIKRGQEERYAAWLKGFVHNRDVIVDQMADSCWHNLFRKFKIICDVLMEMLHEIDLNQPGGNSAMMFAAVNRCIEVCEIAVSLATREQLMFQVAAENYKGCTALHVFVANDMAEVLQQYMERLDRVDRLVMLETHIEGKNFLRKMKVSSLALHLACWSCNEEIFGMLLSYGAELDSKDLNGNTLLHVLIELGLEDPDAARQMIKTVLNSCASRKWYCQKNDLDADHWTAQDDVELKRHMLYIKNYDGYTPLTWAAKHNNRDMIEFILNVEGVYRQTAWQFGRSSFVSYDMREIDPVITRRQQPGTPNVLELLTYRSVARGVMSCFSIPAIEHLIDYKWRYQAQSFIFWAIWHIGLMLICYQIPVIIIKDIRDPTSSNFTNTTQIYTESVSAMDLVKDSLLLQMLLAYVAFSLFTQAIFEINNWGRSMITFIVIMTRRWHGRLYKAPLSVIFKFELYRVVFTIFSVFQVLAVYHLIWRSTITSHTAIAFISGCYFLMYFLQGFRMTSYFGTLMHLVFLTDILSFAFVFVIMLVGFGGTMMIVSYDPLNPLPGFEDLQASTMSMFQFMTGLGVIPELTDVKNSPTVIAVFVLFVCLTIILLLNMLIAAMSETYAKLGQYRKEIWIRNRASMMIMFEGTSLLLSLQINMGKYLNYEKNIDRYSLLVETSVPATCI